MLKSLDMSFEKYTKEALSEEHNLEHGPKIHILDISKAWDTQGELDILREKLHSLPEYKSNLLYCGFSADDIGVRSESNISGVVFAARENNMFETEIDGEGVQNPYKYAMDYDNPAIAAYNQQDLVPTSDVTSFEIKEGIKPKFILIFKS